MLNYLIWILVVAMYSPILLTLYTTRWDKLDYTHAYFILPLSIWLLWQNRTRIKEAMASSQPEKNLLGILMLSFGIFLFIFSWRQNYYFLSTLSLIPLLFGLTIYLYGYNVAKIASFPIFYLLLLVPPPFGVLDSITLPMRNIVSVASEISLNLLGYPITRDGLLLTIGYQEISIGEPCSGFRSLITLLSLGIVYIYLSNSKKVNKIIMTASIVPLAMIGNLFRIITLCLITYYFGEEAGQGFFHNFSGIVMFIITIMGLMVIEGTLNKVLIKN